MSDLLAQVAAATERVGRALLAARGTPGAAPDDTADALPDDYAGDLPDGAIPALSDPGLWLVGAPRLQAVARASDALFGSTLLQQLDGVDEAHAAKAAALASLAGPVEVLLALGGDDRVAPTAGTNSYRMPLADRTPVLRASSCTATPPDGDALLAADIWREPHRSALLSGRGLDPERLRARVATRFTALAGLDGRWAERLILSPSGTDVESLLTTVVAGAGGHPVHVVTVGAREAGSGTVLAAGLRTFRGTAPYASGLTAGERLPGCADLDVQAVDVDLRDARGRVRRSSDIEAELEAHIEYAVEQDARPLVHVMGGSKTGLVCPGADWVRGWTSRLPALRVVLDGAQLRLPRARLADYLAAGASVFVTGSKGIGAPPFCGALLPSDSWWGDAQAMADAGCALPSGLAQSVSTGDLPAVLARLTTCFHPVNVGLLARWEVALAEWQRLDALGEPLRRSLVDSLVTGWRQGLEGLPGVRTFPEPVDLRTIVSFLVAGADGWMDKAALGKTYARIVDAPGVYIGQPVEIVSGDFGVLRLAVGAPTLTRMVARGEELGGLQAAVDECVGIAMDRISGGLPATTRPR